MKAPQRALPVQRRCSISACTLASAVFLTVGSKHSLLLEEKLRKGDLLSVVSAEVDPSTYDDASSFCDDYLCSELMSKFPSWDLGIDREKAAIEKFFIAEEMCAETNLRLSRTYVNGLYSRITPESIILLAREKIGRLLGSFSWDLAEHRFGFGPGATFNLASRFGDAYYKYRAQPCATRDCAMIAYSAVRRVPTWYSHVLSLKGITPDLMLKMSLPERVAAIIDIVPGNRVCTVPKNAKTDRTIAIEPTMNGYIQHGVGSLIRSRLKRVGIDLDDQTHNQRLAYEGSLDGSLATIDLSSASDSVSLELCNRLLPLDWMEALMSCRSPVGVLPDGTEITYQKVSSMGCGFTFELESLIFWALASAVTDLLATSDRRLAVYGDDIIVPTSAAHTLIWILKFCGFSVNPKKTFVSGPFRESCGKHYFRGTDVTPFYIRDDVDSAERVIWLSNQIRRHARLSWGLDGRWKPLYDRCVSVLPKALQTPSIPDGVGDLALFGDFDECLPRRPVGPHNSLHEGYVAIGYVRVCKTRSYADVSYLLRSLSKGRELPSVTEVIRSHLLQVAWKRKLVIPIGSGVPLPNSREMWRTVKFVVPQWSYDGPWLGS